MNNSDDLEVFTPGRFLSLGDETQMIAEGNQQMFQENFEFAQEMGMTENTLNNPEADQQLLSEDLQLLNEIILAGKTLTGPVEDQVEQTFAFDQQMNLPDENENSFTLTPNSTLSPGTPHIPEMRENESAVAPLQENQNQNINLLPDLDINLDALLSAAAFAQTPEAQQIPARRSHRKQFPINPFLHLSKQDRKNVEAGRTILSMIKVLAINENVYGNRYTLKSEKNAILSMSANYTLNIQAEVEQPISSILKRAFALYDCDLSNKDINRENAKYRRSRFRDSAEHAFLMVAVCLLRFKFMYEPEPGTSKHYASDFEAILPKSQMCKNKRLFIKRTKDLCKIIVACGHPCIILILVRIAIRRSIRLNDLLDQLPVQQFCHFLSTGQVSSTNLHIGPSLRNNSSSSSANSGHQLEMNLFYARENILMPLLSIASQRVPQTFFMFDGKVTFNVQACLTAIVPHAFQSQYAAFLRGEICHDAWQAGEVAIETSINQNMNERIILPNNQHDEGEISDPSDGEQSSDERQSSREAEYSIRKDKRTFHNFDFDKYSIIEGVINNPPAFLKNKLLNLSSDI